MKNPVRLLLIVGAVMLLNGSISASAEEVKLNGAASVVDSLIAPSREKVEKATGYRLVIDKSNAGKGLKDLIEGKCDAALASASLEATVQAAKSAGLDRPVPPGLQLHVLKKSEVVFIVHPSNSVKNLTWEQIRDIHSGKITNWKELGGRDLPITIYTDAQASATRGLVKQVVMGGVEYSQSAHAVDFVKKVNDEVAVNEGAIGGLGIGFVDPAKVRIVETKKIERPLAFITNGAPDEKLRKVMEAFRAAGK